MSSVEELAPTPEAYTGEMKIEGIVEITNGDYHMKCKNHFVNSFLYWLINFLSNNNGAAQPYYPNYNWGTTTYIFQVLGTDTVTHTVVGTTGLTSPIGTAPGTANNSNGGSISALTNGTSITFTATWNAGAVSGTVGEVGLYLNLYPSTLQPFQTASVVGSSTNSVLGSRLSVADGDFTAFAINTAVPLTINWTIQFTFS